MRKLLARVPKAQQSRVATMIREVFVQPTQEKARELWRAVAATAHNNPPKPPHGGRRTRRPGLHDIPRGHRQKLHSTNTLERLKKEVKRRADVVGIFPNEASIIRLVGAVLMEQNDEWQLQHHYLSLEPLTGLGQAADEDQILLVGCTIAIAGWRRPASRRTW